MTTKNSPVATLMAQANFIAAQIKQAKHNGKPTVKAGIVMDDKVLTVELTWEMVEATDTAALAEYIVTKMQEKKPDA